MGRRSDFKRVARDCYDTPYEAVLPLLHCGLAAGRFIEPCAGAGALVWHLEAAGMDCVKAFDIAPRDSRVECRDLFSLTADEVERSGADGFITNPPWDRLVLHGMIAHLRGLGLPAWLLIDANWMFTAQAAPYLRYCSRIVTIGRIRWIPDTTMTGKDDCAWFLFQPRPVEETVFHGKQLKEVHSGKIAA